MPHTTAREDAASGRRRPRRWRAGLVTLVALALIAITGATALAYWTTSGAGSGIAPTASLPGPGPVAATTAPASGAVHLTWSALPGPLSEQGFYLTRRHTGPGVPADPDPVPACATDPATLITSTTCDDTGLDAGIYVYTVTAVFNSWTSSADAPPVTVVRGSQTVRFTTAAPAPRVSDTYVPAATGGASGNPVVLGTATPAVCTLAGDTVSFVAVGTCVITADQAGDLYWDPAPTARQAITVLPGVQTIRFTSTPPAAVVDGPVYVITATGGGSGNPVILTSGTPSVCTVAGLPPSGGTATVTFRGAGSCDVVANQAGNANWVMAGAIAQYIPVGKGAQTIAFTSTPVTPVVGSTYRATVSAGASGLAVAFASSTKTVCTVAAAGSTGATVTFLTAGTCTVTADQAGNSNYVAAARAIQTITVGRGAQSVRFTSAIPSGTAAQVGAQYRPAASASTLLPVTFSSVTPTVCAVTSATATSGTTVPVVVTLLSTGTCTVDADQPGTANYAPAPTVSQSFTVVRAPQTIKVTSPVPLGVVVGGQYTVVATATSGLAVSVTSSTTGVCTVTARTVTAVAAGTCSVVVAQAGSADYLAATPVTITFVIGRSAQVLAFTSGPVPLTYLGSTATVTVTGGASGSPIVVATSNAAICSVASIVRGTGVGGSATATVTVNAITAGTCLLTATQAGTTNFTAALPVSLSFAVSKRPQVLAFTSPAASSATVGSSLPVAAAATTPATGAGALSLQSRTSTVCTMASSAIGLGQTITGVVKLVGAGTCTLAIAAAATSSYALTSATMSFAVGKGTQTVSFTSVPGTAAVGRTFTATAKASSALAVTLSTTTPSVCAVVGSTVTPLAVGACTLAATQAGTANYLPAALVTATVTVGPGAQTIVFTTIPPVARIGGTYSVAARLGPSGNPIVFSTSTPTICSVTPTGTTTGLVGYRAAGTCRVLADEAGSANYLAAPQAGQSIVVPKLTQTVRITSTAPVPAHVGGRYIISATGGASGQPLAFTSATPLVCTVTTSGQPAGSALVSMIKIGTCTISVGQAGTSDYAAAVAVRQSFVIS